MSVFADGFQSGSMFHEILHFLALKDEFHDTQLLDKTQAQSIIYDKKYMKFLQDKPQENKIKYECIKQELRQGYDKKVGEISKKLSKTQDGSFSLMMLTSPKTTTEDKTFATLLKEKQCPTIDHIAKQLQRRDVISAKTRLRSADS